MSRGQIAILSAILTIGISTSVKAQYVEVAVTIYNTAKEMRKWQNEQSWGKFKAAKASIPVQVANISGTSVSYSIESKNCSSISNSLAHGEHTDHSCDDGNGDTWYNVYTPYSGGFSVDGGKAVLFEIDSTTGKVDASVYSLAGLEAMLADMKQSPSPASPPPVINQSRCKRGSC